jgi:very-short-patch-repair endonuclease
MRTLWSEEEVKLLFQLYEVQGLSLSELYSEFKSNFNRTIDAVSVKIGKLKLRHTKDQIKMIKSRLNSGIKNGMHSKKSPMNGLTKQNSELIRKKSEKISLTRREMFKNGQLPRLSGTTNPMFGVMAWNKGKNKYSDIRILNSGIKSSKTQKQRWENKTLEEKEIIIQRLNDAMIQVIKPTKIENKIRQFLIKNNLNFQINYPISIFRADFYLFDYNLVIECDGDYWHANPMFYSKDNLDSIQIKNIDRDKRKELFLNENNFNYLRFWENDIKNHFELVKSIIWGKLQNK